jgi:hypothetical protein
MTIRSTPSPRASHGVASDAVRFPGVPSGGCTNRSLRTIALRLQVYFEEEPEACSSMAPAGQYQIESRIKKTPALGLGAVEVLNRACGNLFVRKQTISKLTQIDAAGPAIFDPAIRRFESSRPSQ